MNLFPQVWLAVTVILVIAGVVVVALLAQTAWHYFQNKKRLATPTVHRPGAIYDQTVGDPEEESGVQS